MFSVEENMLLLNLLREIGEIEHPCAEIISKYGAGMLTEYLQIERSSKHDTR